MKHLIAIAAVCCILSTSAYAEYSVANEGMWPKEWPRELDPLRKQSRSLEGPLLPHQHFAIPFASREEFETAASLRDQIRTLE